MMTYRLSWSKLENLSGQKPPLHILELFSATNDVHLAQINTYICVKFCTASDHDLEMTSLCPDIENKVVFVQTALTNIIMDFDNKYS